MNEGFGVRSLHPSVVLLYYAGGITFGMLLFHPLLLIAGWAALLLLNLHLDQGKEWRRWAIPMTTGLLFLIVLNPLISHRGRTVLYYWGDIPITLESVAYGATLAASMLNLLTLFVSYRVLMTEHKFLYLFARLSPKAALLVMMATGLVPRLVRRLQELTLIQRTRGVSVKEGSFRQRAHNGVRLVGTLLSWSLEDALQTADSMQARGYGTGARSSYLDFRFRKRDAVALGLLAAVALAVMAAWWNGHGFWTIYPRLEPFGLSSGDAAALVFYLIYLLLPLGWEWRDRYAWRGWNAGI
ncbi:energy-coupling factor transporter transmembrane component T [Cohnella faecalis]|uniref:Energy-coupling factor transporter transmembrane protein EcfT n=1 Tax=Cohnella faecalis TaxID=2315694 RepID=A0A398CMX2_9BACL|nr:energy-coupling factor transporter transmembrane component T [Cohnella faecalis]RIE01257.1 energy-coupling factor transporter transmembrane protein EcfT [Cohnella faecalis]